jgi:hypothetical protein
MSLPVFADQPSALVQIYGTKKDGGKDKAKVKSHKISKDGDIVADASNGDAVIGIYTNDPNLKFQANPICIYENGKTPCTNNGSALPGGFTYTAGDPAEQGFTIAMDATVPKNKYEYILFMTDAQGQPVIIDPKIGNDNISFSTGFLPAGPLVLVAGAVALLLAGAFAGAWVQRLRG